MRKQELITEAKKLKEAMHNKDCEICRRHASIIEKIENQGDLIEERTIRLVIDNLRRHVVIKHLLLRRHVVVKQLLLRRLCAI